MCVPNLASQRRPQAAPIAVNGVCQSLITQRLLGGFPGSSTFVSTSYAAPKPYPVVPEKTRPKRRRKPQKPGKTAKNNDRHFVVHNYHDHANDSDEQEVQVVQQNHEDPNHKRRGGVAVAFPVKLHSVLDQVEADGLGHVISWMPHGRCFVIHKPTEFVNYVMPKYFRQTKLTSFQRQLNLYGFCRITKGADSGGYYHELFLRGKPFLCKQMVRTKVKGTKFKAASSPDQEPDFYSMPPVIVTPPATSDEEMSHTSDHTHDTMSFYPVPAAAATVPTSMPTAFEQATAAFDPLPIQYQSQPQQQQAPPVNYQPQQPVPAFGEDQLLDEAVDELFLQEAEGDSLADFVQDWDPSSSFADSLQDDSQLGFLLEKLLED